MKERLLDVIKWGLILIIAGAVFYVVCPKYHFEKEGLRRFNRITGHSERWDPHGNKRGVWVTMEIEDDK